MNSNFYSKVTPHSIYALRTIDEDDTPIVFVGKTTSPRLSAIYSRHICGHSKATSNDFTTGNSVDFHLLEELDCTGAQAYKHVLAWINLFMRNEHECLNHETTTEQAIHPTPETKEIIRQLETEPLDLILACTYVENPVDANRKPSQESPGTSTPIKTFQMNVRMTAQDKYRFNHFCKQLNLNQREGFSLLLDRTDTVEHMEHFTALLAKHAKQEASLAEENQRLRDKLTALTANSSPEEAHAKKQFTFLQAGIEEYLNRLLPEQGSTHINSSSYRRYMRSSGDDNSYAYPAEEGFTFLYPKALLWGSSNHRARFLIGTDEDGNSIKLRYFPKRHCVGSHFLDSPYAVNEACWYVGYQRAADGAMDLITLLPLPFPVSAPHLSSPEMPTTSQKPSLANQIKHAESRRK